MIKGSTINSPRKFDVVSKFPYPNTERQRRHLFSAIVEISKSWGLPVDREAYPDNTERQEKYLSTQFIKCCSVPQLVDEVVTKLNEHGYRIGMKRSLTRKTRK